MEKNVLIVCRNLSDVGLISSVTPKTGYRYILASDDLKVQELCIKYPWIDDACWLEQASSVYSVTDRVTELNELISQWLTSLVDTLDGIPPTILAWPCVVEGGMTTQRIQDALLLINSYLHLIDEFHIQGIILLTSMGAKWEDEVLAQTGKSRDVPVKVIGRFRKNILYDRIRSLSKNIARQPYYLTNFFLSKLKSYGNDRREPHRKEIAFQLCGSNDRHIENILPIMKAMENKGYQPLAICWRALEGGEAIRRHGFPAVMFEKYVSLADVLRSLLISFKFFLKAKKSFSRFTSTKIFVHKGVPLAGILWPSVVYFFTAEVPQRYMLNKAIDKYYYYHTPLAIKLWCGGVVAESNLMIRNSRKGNRPLYMHWVLGVTGDDPYESNYANIDLFLASGSINANYLKRFVFPEKRIVSVGMSRYDQLASFIIENDQEKSLAHQCIPSKYSFYILHDAGAIMRGYYSAKEQIETMNTLLLFAKSHSSIALLVKPHPSHHEGPLEDLIDSYSLENVFMIDKNMLPFHAINAANLVITKYSTIGLESMFFERPFISLIMDGEERFKIFGEATEYLMNVEEFLPFLTKLIENPLFFEKWKTEQICKQKEFLKGYSVDDPRPSAELAAFAIDNFIKRHHSLTGKSNAERY